MVARGFAAPSFNFTGGSALMNSGRPVGSTTLAIWPLAPGAMKAAQKTSVPLISHAVFAVRFAIMPRGRLTTILEPVSEGTVFDIYRRAVNVPSVLGNPA